MCERYLLCTDLDRTLIPNGDQPEPQGARDLFRDIVNRPDILLTYVSGRSRQLLQQAIADYELPQPDYAITDVGATLYQLENGNWEIASDWRQMIAADWKGHDARDLQHQINLQRSKLTLQPESGQAEYKLSFEMTPAHGLDREVEQLKTALASLKVNCNLISSIDETCSRGLVDILPASANKRFAIEFLAAKLGIGMNNIFFAGDSGNDLDVILSPIPSVLVGNTTSTVKDTARKALSTANGESVYFAETCYASGIVEGFLHYFPHIKTAEPM